jgi:hypothetical protein
MAKATIPDPLERRHLIEGELAPARARNIAEAYRAEGRVLEAIAFWRKAEANDALEQAVAGAVRAGDAFLVREAARALGREPSAEEWRALAEMAAASGKDRYVAEARRQSERLAGQ